MLYANDKTENREVEIKYIIDNSQTGDKTIDFKNTHEFECNFCKQKLIAKSGNITPHFAHKPGTLKDCDDFYQENEANDPWHRNLQLGIYNVRPDLVKLERIIVRNGKKHINDASIEKFRILIEIQHSSISYEELLRRTTFYALEDKLYWIFDKRNYLDGDKKIKLENKKHVYKTKSSNLGINIPKFFDYVNSLEFRNKYKKVYIIIDNGDGFYELSYRDEEDPSMIYLIRHDLHYLINYRILNKPYTGYNDYMSSFKPVIRNKVRRNVKITRKVQHC